MKNLVIVESPAKAKTIEKYLGKDYSVKSSFGHIRDLPKKDMGVDIENNFEPAYTISADKKKVVSELKKAAKAADHVWLASDEDREGEAIAWHLCKAIGLKPEETKRIVFHEITKGAITKAIENPRTVNQQLVDAQQARRILDRLVGYELSPVLWKKVRPGLSAGRVQSVAVRLVVEREREITAFDPQSHYKVTALFNTSESDLPAELSAKLPEGKTAHELLEHCKSATFTIDDIKEKPGTRNPSAPFTTSTLQQEAARRLGFSVRQTMSLAQRLYEAGYITYMRTDSTVLSQTAIGGAEKYIVDTFGKKYHKVRQFKTKDQSAQEAHEAIRPTNMVHPSKGKDAQQIKLYELIWKRTVASQMAPAQTTKTEAKISISGRKEHFTAKGEVLAFEGYLAVYGGGKDDVILPPLKTGEQLIPKQITATETFSKPPARYSEASLVRKLEELGIGRPSTYAPTISTVQTRGYVDKVDIDASTRQVHTLVLEANEITDTKSEQNFGADRNKLVPTPLADVTTDFLVKNFASVVDYDFTARVEKDFDHIADGDVNWRTMLGEFYKDFHPLVEKSEQVSREESTQTRQLGEHPKTKKPIMARYGRYGPMLQMGETESEEKPAFAPMPPNTSIATVTFEQALEMFKLPRTVGTTTDGKEIKANIGRFGPYIQVEKLYISIKPHDPRDITEEEARKLYRKKLEQEKKKNIKEFEKSGIKILNGPYGPYVTDGKKNVRIKKDVDPTKLTEEQCKEMIEKAPVRKKRRKKRQ